MYKLILTWIKLFILLLLLTGCLNVFRNVAFNKVEFAVDNQINDSAPIAVDIVAVDDVQLLKTLQGIVASKWFEQKTQFMRDYPQTLHVWGLELVPGQRFSSEDIPLPNGKAGMLLYANYVTPGVNRLNLTDQKNIEVFFDVKGMRLMAPDP